MEFSPLEHTNKVSLIIAIAVFYEIRRVSKPKGYFRWTYSYEVWHIYRYFVDKNYYKLQLMLLVVSNMFFLKGLKTRLKFMTVKFIS